MTWGNILWGEKMFTSFKLLFSTIFLKSVAQKTLKSYKIIKEAFNISAI